MVVSNGNVNSIILMKSFYLFVVDKIDKLHIKYGMRMKTGCAHRPSAIIAACPGRRHTYRIWNGVAPTTRHPHMIHKYVRNLFQVWECMSACWPHVVAPLPFPQRNNNFRINYNFTVNFFFLFSSLSRTGSFRFMHVACSVYLSISFQVHVCVCLCVFFFVFSHLHCDFRYTTCIWMYMEHYMCTEKITVSPWLLKSHLNSTHTHANPVHAYANLIFIICIQTHSEWLRTLFSLPPNLSEIYGILWIICGVWYSSRNRAFWLYHLDRKKLQHRKNYKFQKEISSSSSYS